MRFSIATVIALAAGAFATSAAPSYTTEVLTSYETYCPEATSIVHSDTTYVVSTPATLTLTGGSYTVTRPLLTSTVTICNACGTGTAPTSAAPTVPPVYSGSTVAVTSAPTTPAAPVFTGGANRLTGAGAGLAGLAGVAAFLL